MTHPAYRRGDEYLPREAKRSITTMVKADSPAAGVDLDVLDDFLLSDRAPEDGMGLSDLDGFLSAIIIESIPPSEWLSAHLGR